MPDAAFLHIRQTQPYGLRHSAHWKSGECMDRTTVGDFGVARPRMSDHADAGWSGREQDGRPIENLKYLYDLVIAAARRRRRRLRPFMSPVGVFPLSRCASLCARSLL